MNNAIPADESHADGGGVATTVVSGGGATATTVSFRPGTGALRSQANMASTASSPAVILSAVPAGRASRGITGGMLGNLHAPPPPSIDDQRIFSGLRHPT